MRPTPIEGQPGIYRESDGNVFDIRDFMPYETSVLVPNKDYIWVLKEIRFYLDGWRFTCAQWPADPRHAQQQVELWRQNHIEATMSLGSILTSALDPKPQRHLEQERLDLYMKSGEVLNVELQESPVEGAGLRLHLRGRILRVVK